LEEVVVGMVAEEREGSLVAGWGAYGGHMHLPQWDHLEYLLEVEVEVPAQRSDQAVAQKT
jgi:hypothetical protein